MTSNRSRPIGFFDSGVGGISIFNEVIKLLPNEEYIYLSDSKNAPYGVRSSQEITNLSIKNTRLLLDQDCKLIVVACNTATTNAIDELRSKFDVPFIGIEPAVKPAILNSRLKRIGVLATKGTLSSELFARSVREAVQHKIKITEIEGKGLVESVESGDLQNPQFIKDLKILIRPFIQQKIDFLVLGCTHYSFLRPILTDILPASIQIIDAAKPVAKRLDQVLQELDLKNDLQRDICEDRFYTNKDPEILSKYVPADARRGTKVAYLDF